MGRPAKPTFLKEVTGNPGGRPLNKKEPKPKRKFPIKPVGLRPVADKYWDRLRDNLVDLGILSGVDEDAMETMANLYADIQELQSRVIKEGFTYWSSSESGELMKANPAVAQLRTAQGQFKVYLTEFGMTPASRSKIRTDKEDDGNAEDPAEQHFG